MSDSIIYDMAEQTQGQPNIFLNKSWLSILDNQNNSYAGNQCVIETSALSNNNKYLNYREAYLSVPLLLTLTAPTATANPFIPATTTSSADWAVGLKNWYGSVIHSISVDMGGSTIIQQTSFANMFNSFKLLTTLSINDIQTQGASIGFYPDTAGSVAFTTAVSTGGIGTQNNNNAGAVIIPHGTLNQLEISNKGYTERQKYWNFDPEGLTMLGGDAFSTLISAGNLTNLYKSYIFNKISGVANTNPGVWQAAIMATIKLKHLHNFFEKIPLAKGLYFRMTLTLNQPSVQFSSASAGGALTLSSVSVPSGGVSPLMISSAVAGSGGVSAFPVNTNAGTLPYTLSLAVGASVLNSTQSTTAGVAQGPLSRGVQLYIPAYAFSPMFESAYLSSPVKNIVYTDIYQYLVPGITANQNINQLITNGISSLKSILCIPFYTATANGAIDPILSPYDPAGCGPTSPFCHLGNFNVVISGQNAIYNTQVRNYEAFNHNLYGCHSVNGGQTDGLTSGLLSQFDFETEYCYYYVNVGRMLDIEQSVPKSVSIIGTNYSAKAINLYVFCEYGVQVGIDLLTGARTQ
jgi:hypothetical protein